MSYCEPKLLRDCSWHGRGVKKARYKGNGLCRLLLHNTLTFVSNRASVKRVRIPVPMVPKVILVYNMLDWFDMGDRGGDFVVRMSCINHSNAKNFHCESA